MNQLDKAVEKSLSDRQILHFISKASQTMTALKQQINAMDQALVDHTEGEVAELSRKISEQLKNMSSEMSGLLQTDPKKTNNS
jgi:bifunctional ADP-heptose synthase (sugar kinase/adenylyltransferase)